MVHYTSGKCNRLEDVPPQIIVGREDVGSQSTGGCERRESNPQPLRDGILSAANGAGMQGRHRRGTLLILAVEESGDEAENYRSACAHRYTPGESG